MIATSSGHAQNELIAGNLRPGVRESNTTRGKIYNGDWDANARSTSGQGRTLGDGDPYGKPTLILIVKVDAWMTDDASENMG